jgi:S1-C subfamily serine protease
MLERSRYHRATIIAGLAVVSLWAGLAEARSHPEGRVGVPASRRDAPLGARDLLPDAPADDAHGRAVKALHDLHDQMARGKARARIALRVWRDGKTLTLPAVLEEYP